MFLPKENTKTVSLNERFLAVFLLCCLMLYKVVSAFKTVTILIRKTLLSRDGSEMKFIFVKKEIL